VKLLREIDPTLEWKWDVRDAITVRPKGSTRFWARIKTKEADALELWLIGARGQTALSTFEGIGRDATLENDRTDGCEVLKVWMVTGNHLQSRDLKPILAEHLSSFKRAFGNGKAAKEAS
jgi:excinuclease ABC subunit A